VIGLIENVANQTHLLAAEATSRPARAGADGARLGVVAHEVSSLPPNSRATEDVRGGLQGIAAASGRIADRVARLVESIEQVDAVAGRHRHLHAQQDTIAGVTSNSARPPQMCREVAANVKHVAGMIAAARRAADLSRSRPISPAGRRPPLGWSSNSSGRTEGIAHEAHAGAGIEVPPPFAEDVTRPRASSISPAAKVFHWLTPFLVLLLVSRP